MRPLAIVVLASVLLAPATTLSQNLDTLDAAFRSRLRTATDSLIGEQKKYAETLFTHGDDYSYSSAWSLHSKLDSILLGTHDSLDLSRENNVRLLNREQDRSMNDIGVPQKRLVNALLTQYEKDLHILYSAKQTCPTCKTSADYDSMFTLFEAQADSISGFYGDSMATIVESWETSIDDASTTFAESLNDTLDVLKADYVDYLKAHASRLEIDAGYESHANYRGRDNGVSESSFGPTVTYHHKTGLYLAGSLGWVSRSLSSPDVSSLSAGYEFTPSSIMQGSIAYTHFWYSASSPLPQSVTSRR